MRRLGVAHTLLHSLDFVFNVAVGDEDVGPAVVVVIEEEAAEAERHQGVAADLGLWGFVDEEAVALVVVERDHLVGEIADNQAGMAAAVVVGSVGAHAGAGNAVFAEADSCSDSALFECAVFLIHIQLVGLRIVGDQDFRPSVDVRIEDGDPEALRRRVSESSFLSGVFEFSSAKVVPETQRCAFVGFRRAVGFMCAVYGAVEVTRFAPLDIIRNDEIEFAVAIVVNPGGASGEFVRAPHARCLGQFSEGAVAVVVEEMTLA